MSSDQKEYIVRVPSDTKKQFHVMRFSSALNVDVTKLKNCKLEREIMFKEIKEQQEEELPEFGAGSEFGRKEKEEARRRKFERRKNKQNNSPWILKVGGKHGKKYRGIREGGVTENASYYVFFQASDGMFEAFPVNEWYNFTPFQRYKALSAEEAEEKFIKRDQILNFFQLRNMAKTKEGDKDDSSKKSQRKMKKEFKVSDMDDWYDMSENDDDNFSGDGNDDSDEDTKQRKSRKDKGKKDKRKIKKEDSDEEEPLEDSDEGDYDDKEVDYMSDESSSSESEEEKVGLKGVADESALRDLVVSEEDEEEEGANKYENQEQNEDANKSIDSDKLKSNKLEKKTGGNDSSSESDFDSENSDIEEPKSALLIQPSKNLNKSSSMSTPVDDSKSTELSAGNKRKLEQDSSSQSTSLPNKDNNSSNNKSNGLKFKHKLENPMANEHSMAKKMKVKHDSGITEEAVRRYLIRKPMTAADLVQKFKNKTARKEKLTDLLAEILRKINPEIQNIKGKMYLSLKPT